MDKKLSVLLLALIFIYPLAHAQNPVLEGMWTNTSLKKTKVYTIEDTTLICNHSEAGNRFSSQVKKLSIRKLVPGKDPRYGRIIALQDSESVRTFHVFDYFLMSDDSAKFIERPERFQDVESAGSSPNDLAGKGILFYSNEWLNRQYLIKNTPALTKESYLAFLRDVAKELKKSDYINMKIEPGKTTEVLAYEFMNKMLGKKEYSGKIIPETLDEANKKFKNEEAVKKVMPSIKASFMPKKSEVKS